MVLDSSQKNDTKIKSGQKWLLNYHLVSSICDKVYVSMETNVSTFKTQCNAGNSCINRLWQRCFDLYSDFSVSSKKKISVLLLLLHDVYLRLFLWVSWHFQPNGTSSFSIYKRRQFSEEKKTLNFQKSDFYWGNKNIKNCKMKYWLRINAGIYYKC